MRKPVIRTFRLTESAHDAFREQDMFPKRSVLHAHLVGRKVPGRSYREISRFLDRRAITRSFAEAFVAFLHQVPERIPPVLRSGGASLPTFDDLFEEIEACLVEGYYVQPDKTNDPSMLGIGAISGAVAHTVFKIGSRDPAFDSHLAYLDGETGLLDYERIVFTDRGFSGLQRGEQISVQQAYERGKAEFPPDANGALTAYVARLINVNPDFVRYALTTDGERIGVSCAYAITDEAYADTLAGKHDLYSYQDEDIVPLSNNVVLLTLAETHDVASMRNGLWRRKSLIGSLLYQIASIIDLDNRRPVRTISYEITTANTKRLRKMGYRHVATISRPPAPNYNVVAYNPLEQSFSMKFVAMILDDFVWRVRASIEEVDSWGVWLDDDEE